MLFIVVVLSVFNYSYANLALVRLDSEYVDQTGARCLDGSNAGYYIEAGAESTKWVISLEGGGLCFDKAGCTARITTSLGSSNYFGATYGGSYTNPNRVANPGFWNWTRVHIPYCSGDLWTGTQTENSTLTFGLYFAGHLIFKAVVEDIVAKYGFTNATEVLLAGGSAGALGLTSNIDWLNDRVPNASISALMNAGWFTDFTPSWTGPTLSDSLALAFAGLYKSRVNAACVAANPNNASYCGFPLHAWKYLPNRLYSAQSLVDTSLLQNLRFPTPLSTALAASGAGEYVLNVGNYLRCSLLTDFTRNPLNDGVFVTTCFRHGLDWTGLVIQGRTIAQNVAAWYHRANNVERVTYDECDIQSVIDLVKSNTSLINDCQRLMELCTKISENPFARAVEDAENSPTAEPSTVSPVTTPSDSIVEPDAPITQVNSAVVLCIHVLVFSLWLLM
jgi:hypothetical protein